MNDPLIDVSSNTSLYEAWYAAGRPIELHLYAKGGHGFGLISQGLPSDGWIDRLSEWLGAKGFSHVRRYRNDTMDQHRANKTLLRP